VMRGMLRLAPRPLELLGFDSGATGLRAIRSAPPDLLLLDLHLPDMSGLDLLQQLRAEPRFARLPVVIVSADALNEQVRAGLAAGASAYLTNPIQLEELLHVLERLLAKPAG